MQQIGFSFCDKRYKCDSVTWSLTEASLPKRLIGVFETVYEADQSPALRLGTHWKEVILDPSVVALFFTVSHLTLSDDS